MTTHTIPVSEVHDLSFQRIADDLSHKWAIWEVSFCHDGKPYVGFLGGCPRYPDLMHDEVIEDCDLDY